MYQEAMKALARGLHDYGEDSPYVQPEDLTNAQQVVGVLFSVLEVMHPGVMGELTPDEVEGFLRDCGFTDMAFIENYLFEWFRA